MDARAPDHRNDVTLVGRLSAGPVVRDLPSGDAVTSWRLVVERTPRNGLSGDQPSRANRTVDALECATFLPEVAQVMASAQSGDLLEVKGALRRRFWRSSTGVASRYEVETTAARCLVAADQAPPAEPCP